MKSQDTKKYVKLFREWSLMVPDLKKAFYVCKHPWCSLFGKNALGLQTPLGRAWYCSQQSGLKIATESLCPSSGPG